MYKGEYTYTYQVTTQNTENFILFKNNIKLIQKQERLEKFCKQRLEQNEGNNWVKIIT